MTPAPAPGIAPGIIRGNAPARAAITLLETLLAAAILSASVGSTALVLRESSSRSAHNALQREALEALRQCTSDTAARGPMSAETSREALAHWTWTDGHRTWRANMTDDTPPPPPGLAPPRTQDSAHRSTIEDTEPSLFLWRRIDVVVDDRAAHRDTPAFTLWRLVPPPPPAPESSPAPPPGGSSRVPSQGEVAR